jgi:hypothetical protein
MAELATAPADSSLTCSTGAFLNGRPCHPGVNQVVDFKMSFTLSSTTSYSPNGFLNLRKKVKSAPLLSVSIKKGAHQDTLLSI